MRRPTVHLHHQRGFQHRVNVLHQALRSFASRACGQARLDLGTVPHVGRVFICTLYG
jgi:hypothetical protein